MPIDGKSATKLEMQSLKEVCRRIKNRYRERYGKQFDWYNLFNDKMNLGVSQGYESNLGKGIAGQATVLTIYRWIIENELELASAAAPEIFSRSLVTTWQGFVNERGTYGALRIRPFVTGSLHDISDLHPISETRIRLGQEFIFELNCPHAGSVIALNRFKGQYYPVPLHIQKGFRPIRVEIGSHGFPLNLNDAIIPMRQRNYGGEHGHCFIIGPEDLMSYYASGFEIEQPLQSALLDKMAKRFAAVSPDSLSIHLENVIFE